MKTKFIKPASHKNLSDLITMSKEEQKSIQGGGQYEIVQRADGTWVFKIIYSN